MIAKRVKFQVQFSAFVELKKVIVTNYNNEFAFRNFAFLRALKALNKSRHSQPAAAGTPLRGAHALHVISSVTFFPV
jgi:hypothetical protein